MSQKTVFLSIITILSVMAAGLTTNTAQAQAPAEQVAVLAQTQAEQETAKTQTAEQGADARILNLPIDLHIAIGFKTWFSDWMAGGEVFNNGHARKLDTDGKAYIPTLGVRYKDFFISASGLFGTDYDRAKVPHTAQGGVMKLSRKEVDFNVGYYVLSWLAISAGYKGVFLDFVDTATAPVVARQFEVQYQLQGPTLGVSLNVPIPEWNEFPSGFSVYGNAGGGYMDVQSKQIYPSIQNNIPPNYNHAWYSNVEGGIAYKPPALPFVLSAGYRFQNIAKFYTSRNKSNPNLSNTENDTLKGAVLGITFVY